MNENWNLKKKIEINLNLGFFVCFCFYVFLCWFDVVFDLCEMINVFNVESGDFFCFVVC